MIFPGNRLCPVSGFHSYELLAGKPPQNQTICQGRCEGKSCSARSEIPGCGSQPEGWKENAPKKPD